MLTKLLFWNIITNIKKKSIYSHIIERRDFMKNNDILYRNEIILCMFTAINRGKIFNCSFEDLVSKRVKSASRRSLFVGRNLGYISNRANKQRNPKNIIWKEQEMHVKIKTFEQLVDMIEKVNAGDKTYCYGSYELCNDIDCKKKKLEPLGSNKDCPFRGRFEGNGHTISNFKIKVKCREFCGFFGYLLNASVSNLHIKGNVCGGTYTGLFAGVCYNSLIQCCSAQGKVKGKKYVAGFVAYNLGEIATCNVKCKICSKTTLPVVH